MTGFDLLQRGSLYPLVFGNGGPTWTSIAAYCKVLHAYLYGLLYGEKMFFARLLYQILRLQIRFDLGDRPEIDFPFAR